MSSAVLNDSRFQILILVVIVVICWILFHNSCSTDISKQSLQRSSKQASQSMPAVNSGPVNMSVNSGRDVRPPEVDNMSVRPKSNFLSNSRFLKSNYQNAAYVDTAVRNKKVDEMSHFSNVIPTTHEVDTSLYTGEASKAHSDHISKNGAFRSAIAYTNTEDQNLGVQPFNQYAVMRQSARFNIPYAEGALTVNSTDPSETNPAPADLQIGGLGGGWNNTGLPFETTLTK